MKRTELIASAAVGPDPSRNRKQAAPAVEAKSISMGDGENGTLQDVSLRVEASTHIALVGPPGSGKSTLLACIAGREKASQGKLKCRGKLSFVEQSFVLEESKSALDNVLTGIRRNKKWRTRLFGISQADQQRAEELLSRFGLNSVSEPVGSLRPVERILIATSRALMEDPDILLIDEPISGLSLPDSERVLRSIHEEAVNRAITTITVLNDFSLAGKYCDRVIALEKGIIVYDGTNIDPWPEQRAEGSWM